MGLLSDPTCDEESALHFFMRVPNFANLRSQIFGKPILSVTGGDAKTQSQFLFTDYKTISVYANSL
jgi:hypothetical protein